MTICKNPIFILGISHRSGTNFLWDLLKCHPDIEGHKIIEDHILSHSSLLFQFTNKLHTFWVPEWGINSSESRASLLRHLGNGLISFLNSQVPNEKRFVIKTPSVNNIEHFFTLFPECQLLIIVRDGRDLVESNIRSFSTNFEEILQRYVKGAKTIQNAIQSAEFHSDRYLLVKYEKLFRDTSNEMRKILNFLKLDMKSYDFAFADNLPVRGSSTFQRNGATLNWDSAPKSSNFNPIGQWKHWSLYRKQRFNWVAGKVMVQLGYMTEHDLESQLSRWSILVNRLLDFCVGLALNLYKRYIRHSTAASI